MVSPKTSLLGLQVAALLLPLHMVIFLCTHIPTVSLYVQVPPSYKDTSRVGLGPTLTVLLKKIFCLLQYVKVGIIDILVSCVQHNDLVFLYIAE